MSKVVVCAPRLTVAFQSLAEFSFCGYSLPSRAHVSRRLSEPFEELFSVHVLPPKKFPLLALYYAKEVRQDGAVVRYTSAMDNDTANRLATLEAKIDAIYRSVEKTRQYFMWTLISTAVMFLLPLVLLLFAIPSFLSVYSDMSNLSDLGI